MGRNDLLIRTFLKRIKPSIIYRLLLIGLGSPMVIYGLVRPLTIETRD
ncbi:hypothetical protein [Escherichia coli]|nr:hypothetical protein [Escherichia coli]